MPGPDIFAFKKSGLDGFLFAHVGTELNGSALTVQSMLARLGRDPWAEAARCASMPLPAVIDGLSASIAQMPLSPQCLADARATAETLSRLLPPRPGGAHASVRMDIPVWATVVFLSALLFLGLALNLTSSSGTPAPAVATDPARPPTQGR